MILNRSLRIIGLWLTGIRFLGKKITMGKSSTVSRHAILSCENGGRITLGAKTRIHPHAMLLTNGGDIAIGEHTTVNPFTILYGTGGLSIGNGVRIAAHCVIVPAQHRFDRTDIPIYRQGFSAAGIVIEDDVWIGANCTILDGVRIGKGSIIGAGSVVTKSIAQNSIAVGVPARVIRTRQ